MTTLKVLTGFILFIVLGVIINIIWGDEVLHILLAIIVTAFLSFGLGWEMGINHQRDFQRKQEEELKKH